MKSAISLVALSLAVSMSASLDAQGRGNGQAKKPTAASTQTTPKADRIKTVKPVKPVKTDVQVQNKAPKSPKTTVVAATTPVPVPVITPTTPTTGRVKNPKLESRLLALLPPGTTVQDASAGFKNWGQFVAAVHVSNNLSIPFADLKTQMTGPNPLSLGQSIQTLKGATTTPESGTLTPTKIKSEVKKAEDAANDDLRLTRDRS